METVGELVEVAKTRRHTHQLTARAFSRLNLVDSVSHSIGQRDVVFCFHPAGHLVNLGLGVVDELVDLTLTGVAHIGNSRPGVD